MESQIGHVTNPYTKEIDITTNRTYKTIQIIPKALVSFLPKHARKETMVTKINIKITALQTIPLELTLVLDAKAAL